MSSYENEDALRRAPALGCSNENRSDRSSKKRESSRPIVSDDYRYKRRHNSPARTRSFTNNCRTNGSISNETNDMPNDVKNNRGPYNDRPQFPSKRESSRPTCSDEYGFKRRPNSPARTRSFTNNCQTNVSRNNERIDIPNDVKFNRGFYNGRPPFPSNFPSSSHDQWKYGSSSQYNITNPRKNNIHNSRGSQKKTLLP